MRFTTEQNRHVLDRDLGRCVLVDVSPVCTNVATVANHRSNDGHGGRPGVASLANACALCSACNGAIEADAELAQVARTRGVKLTRQQNPDHTPYYSPAFGWMQPHTDGTTTVIGNVPEKTAGALAARIAAEGGWA